MNLSSGWSGDRSKSILAQTADGANPILRDVLPGGARGNSAFGIADLRIVDVPAGAFVLSHVTNLLRVIIIKP